MRRKRCDEVPVVTAGREGECAAKNRREFPGSGQGALS